MATQHITQKATLTGADFRALAEKADAARKAANAAYEELLVLGTALEQARDEAGLAPLIEELAFRGRKGAAEALNRAGAVRDYLQQEAVRAEAAAF